MDFKTITFLAGVNCQAKSNKISSGHIQQILASGLGYGSLAAYQASTEENPGIDGASHVFLDLPAMSVRSHSLGQGNGDTIITAIKEAITSGPTPPQIHASVKDFFDNVISEYVEQNVENEDGASSASAETNGAVDSVEVEPDKDPAPISTSPDEWDVSFVFSMHIDQDPDRVFHGDKVTGSGIARLRKVGRVCLEGDIELVDVAAGVDMTGYYDEEPN
jgi:hypothetical protein